jgi:glycosyltransferase involved in cell wall biosynthesis
MRVFIYSHSFAPAVGGVETFAMLLAKGLSNSTPSIEVQVATLTPSQGSDDAALPFQTLRRPSVWALAKAILDADVVQLCGPCLLPQLIAWVARKPVVIEQHGYQAICPNGLLLYEPSKTACPGHFMARRYSKCVECNSTTEGLLRSVRMLLLTPLRRWQCKLAENTPITEHVLRRLALPRSRVIYYGVPCVDRVPNSGALTSRSAITFAYVGRLASEKGLAVLLRAASEARAAGYGFRVEFIGGGPEEQTLRALTRELGLESCVSFCGFLKGDALEAKMEAVAVLVMPSIWEETAGLAAMEQMMRGRLVIASDTGGLSEVVGHAGLKFRRGDSHALAECMKRVVDDPGIVERFGAAARTRALAEFQLSRMIADHVKLYKELLQAASRG